MSQFPRYSRLGQLTWEEPGFWMRQWLDDTRRIWQNGLATLVEGQEVGPPFTKLGAGGGRWAGSTLSHSDPTFSFSGREAWIENPQSNEKRLMAEWTVNGESHVLTVAVGPIIELRRSDTCLAWTHGNVPMAWTGGIPFVLASEGGWCIPVDTPDGPWVVMMRGSGIWVQPAVVGPVDGFFVETHGHGFYPDAWCDGRVIEAAWGDGLGALPTARFSIDAPRQPFPQPEPDPDPDPEPIPEPMQMPDSLLPLVQTVFQRRLGHLTRPANNDECAVVMNEVAWTANGGNGNGPWGLSKKPGGNNAKQPRTGILVAYDILQHRDTPPPADLWDALGPSEDPKPKWGQAHPHNDPNRPWVAPVAPDGVVVPPPDPPDPPPPPPQPDLLPRVLALEAEVRRLHEITDALAIEDRNHASRLTELELQPPPGVDVTKLASALARSQLLRAKSNGGWLGHSHDIELKP